MDAMDGPRHFNCGMQFIPITDPRAQTMLSMGEAMRRTGRVDGLIVEEIELGLAVSEIADFSLLRIHDPE